jgi:RNA polymerase sigma factor (sigma-70 family)
LSQFGAPPWTALFATVAADPDREDAWSSLYVALWPYLSDWVTARYGLDAAATADVIQDALMDYRSKLVARRIAQPSLAHVRGFVRLAALEALRGRARLLSLDDLGTEPVSDDPERDVIRRLIVDQALDRLDRRCAYVLRAKYYRGHSTAEIAASMGLEPGNVDVLLHRCRQRCRELVMQRPTVRAPR